MIPRRLFTAGVVALTLTAASAASAATYELEHCTSANPGTLGWSPSGDGVGAEVAKACSTDQTMSAYFDETVGHSNGEFAEWRFTPPADTSLASLSATNRAFRSGFGSSIAYATRNTSDLLEQCVRGSGCTTLSGPRTYDLQAASRVSFGVRCGGTSCPADSVYANLTGFRVALNDAFQPLLTQSGGSLTTPTSTDVIRTFTYTVTDRGGGVFQRQVLVDGVAGTAEPAEPDTPCSAPFTVQVPCPLTADDQVAIDTAALADGDHQIAVRFTDATGVNAVQSPTYAVSIDNQPPATDTPTVEGTPRVGSPLSCAVTVTDGQSPTIAYQWLRAAADGSDPVAIANATASSYTPVAQDENRKLLCRTTVTDGGGATTKTSSATAGAFANGATVAPATTSPTDGTGTGTTTTPTTTTPPTTTPPTTTTPDPTPTPTPAPTTTTTTTGTTTAPTTTTPPTTPGSGTTPAGGTPAGGTPAGGTTTPGAGTTPPGATAATVAQLSFDDRTPRVRRASWLRSGFVVRGSTRGTDGLRRGGAPIVVSQIVRGKSRRLGTVQSDTDGSWRFSVPRGPSRTLVFTDGSGTSRQEIRQRVRAHVTLKPVQRRIRRAGRATFRGRLRGGYTNSREKLVEFQVYYRQAWRTISTTRVSTDGRFTLRYRFGTAARGVFAFRARTLPTDGYPFTSGTSGSRAARVRVG